MSANNQNEKKKIALVFFVRETLFLTSFSLSSSRRGDYRSFFFLSRITYMYLFSISFNVNK